MIREVDPMECPICHAEMKIIGFFHEAAVIKKILKHLNLWEEDRSPLSPTTITPPEFFLERAAPAEWFDCLPAGKALADLSGAWTFQDDRQRLLQNITQGRIGFGIQAAGHNSAVYQICQPKKTRNYGPRSSCHRHTPNPHLYLFFAFYGIKWYLSAH